MNEAHIRRLSQHALLLSTFVALVACGGTATTEAPGGADAPAPGAPNGNGGGAGGSIGQAGNGEVGGSAATAGRLGNAAGEGGTAQAGSGSGGAGNGPNLGSGGYGDESAGMGQGGLAADCHAAPEKPCSGGPIQLPRTCISEAAATAGTVLPASTCAFMCESPYGGCTVAAVQQTTITVLCRTGCPASQ